ncbi:dihydrouridine synthase [Macellibacteroides sp. HH-ZS]|nr:dihydrouridine synthase [Macellibacteroides sp. HH-ZS]
MTGFEIHFAPLQGYTDCVYRKVHAAIFGGVDAYYTPFLRVENGGVRSKDLRDIVIADNSPHFVIPQLIAANPDELSYLTDLVVKEGYNRVDINMGCPFPKQTRLMRGARLLAFPEDAARLLACTKDYPSVSFSVKLRHGWDDCSQFEEILAVLNDLPLMHVTLHPRLGIQQYKGQADKDIFARFYNLCRIPLYYNGDIGSVAEIYELKERFPNIAGVMLGRGLLAHPWLASEWKQGETLTDKERRTKLIGFLEQLLDAYTSRLEGGEHQLLAKMQTLWDYLLPDADKKLRKKILKSHTLPQYLQAVSSLLTAY